MKTTLRAKLLQHLVSKKKANEGFTLIELLVVIIIIGILAAIALPSFLNQANKARQTEASTNVGAINRGQQAYFLEEDEFSQTIGGVGVGIKVKSDTYSFGASTAYDTNVNETLGLNGANMAAAGGDWGLAGGLYGAPANTNTLKTYGGIAYILVDPVTTDVTSTVILCEADQAGTVIDFNGSTLDANGRITEANCNNGDIK